MKILLLGEYSGVHSNLAKGLRALGHTVTVASNGDFWKNYPRDIDLQRSLSLTGTLNFLRRLCKALPRMKGFDIVQLINPMFLELKAERLFPIYKYLRKNNRHIVLCAMGMDYYWVNTCVTAKPLRYSDFNIGDKLRTNADALAERAAWIGTAKERLNKFIAHDCDHIVTGLYEYHVCYKPVFENKTTFIPLPIDMDECRKTGIGQPEKREKDDNSPYPNDRQQAGNIPSEKREEKPRKIKIFIGINVARSEYKGTDIMLRAAQDVASRHPDAIELIVARSVPFSQYSQMMNSSDVILDQLYSYTPAMNALLAMSKGIVCVGGGEPESYDILNEHSLHPIINVQPTYESVYSCLEQIALHPESIPALQNQSVEYVRRHHDHIKVARQYEQVYKQLP